MLATFVTVRCSEGGTIIFGIYLVAFDTAPYSGRKIT